MFEQNFPYGLIQIHHRKKRFFYSFNCCFNPLITNGLSTHTSGPRFNIIGRHPDLQVWFFGTGLEDDELAILASGKSRIYRIFQGLISTLQLVERLDRYPLINKRKIDSVEPEEISMNVKKEGTQVSNYVVQHLPRNPSIFSGEDGEDLQEWLKGYARVARYNHWDETLCLTKVYFYLSGTALKWFENNEESIQTWKEFTSQLENVFGKKENSKLQAEKKLKTRAQLKGESTECYIQDVLCLCKEVDPQMSEEDIISHLMKGIAEELYQALLPRDVQSTEQFITECRRVEALRCRRVTPTRYEAETIRPHPEPRYPKQGERCDTNDWRTTEGRPICFYCGRPGHVVRYCRDRKRHNEERRNDYFQRKQDAMVSYNSRAESQDPNDESSRKTFTRYRSPTSYRGRNRQHFSPARRSSWTPRH
ncbi:ASPRV1 [Cordylochernes scorpioides]|uniref:ASPRV1 n=1 Tax=Cordylochernes scorpioides TaxID=51811 RepID=A0ABY6LDD6_9ARAC|nr:ASPRV1 [Cordylochernes scorpioides]